MSNLPSVQHLIATVDATEFTELDRVRAAVVMADDLGVIGDQVVTHFVEAARTSGCSWSQIGAQLGVSKQAAQQAFVAATPRRGRFGRRPEMRPRGRWSAAAKAVVVGAREEAGALGHDHVGTEHLLLALARGSGVAATALRSVGAEPDVVLAHVVEIIGRGSGDRSLRRPFTPRAKKVLELSVRESVRLHHDDLRTEHLLLGLVREGDGVAAQILTQKLGVDLPRVSKTVLDLLTDGGPGTPGEAPTD
jgi:ClpA/ClpB-like protein